MGLMVKVIMSVLLLCLQVNFANGETVTLQQSVSIALKDSPALRSYHWIVEAQKQEVKTAKGSLFPKVKIEERYQRTDNPTYGFMSKLNQERFTQDDFIIGALNNPRDISDFQTSLSFEQPLFLPGVYSGVRISGKELEAKQAEYQRKKEEVILHVVKTFTMVQTAREYLTAARKGMEDAREHKRIASLKYETGAGLYADVLRAEVSVKSAESMLVRAESNHDVARRRLGLVLGRTGPVDVSGDKPVLPVDHLQSYIDASVQRNDLNALRLRYKNSKTAVEREKSVFLPEIGLGGSYFLNDHEDPFSPEGESYVIAGFLRWNLFDASAYHRIGKAKTMVREAEEHISGLEKEIHFRVNEAYIRVREMEQNLSLSRALLTEAEEALRLVRLRYENALAPLVDLLDTQAVLDRARAGQAEADNAYLNAIAELYYQSGILLTTLHKNEK